MDEQKIEREMNNGGFRLTDRGWDGTMATIFQSCDAEIKPLRAPTESGGG